MAEYKGVMVYGELLEGKISSITTELLGCGRRLADELKEDLVCILVGDKLDEAPKKSYSFRGRQGICRRGSAAKGISNRFVCRRNGKGSKRYFTTNSTFRTNIRGT